MKVARKPINRRSIRLSLDQIIRSVSVDDVNNSFLFFINHLFILWNSVRTENYVPCSIVFCYNFKKCNYDT